MSINIDVTCLHIVTLAYCRGWHRRGGIMKSFTANVGGGGQNHTVCFKGESRKCSFVATKLLPHPLPEAINKANAPRLQRFIISSRAWC